MVQIVPRFVTGLREIAIEKEIYRFLYDVTYLFLAEFTFQ